jgi:hypothetical protein
VFPTFRLLYLLIIYHNISDKFFPVFVALPYIMPSVWIYRQAQKSSKISVHSGIVVHGRIYRECIKHLNLYNARRYLPLFASLIKWLMGQDLLSVKELWVNINYPATAR